jgi:predicted tellurium resistance membrane protein TerC
MGLDNVLAVAGAAHGSFALVILGLLISIPIVVAGSTFILHWVERFPAIIHAGAAVLAWTAAKMVLGEPLLQPWVDLLAGDSWLVYVAAIGGVMLSGWLRRQPATAAWIALGPSWSRIAIPAGVAAVIASLVFD